MNRENHRRYRKTEKYKQAHAKARVKWVGARADARVLLKTERFLWRLIATDLAASQPFYVVDGRAIGLSDDLLGVHFNQLDVAAFSNLKKRWRGRGAGVAINISALRLRYPVPKNCELATIIVGIHELAHAVAGGLDREPMPQTPEAASKLNTKVREIIAADPIDPVDVITHHRSHSHRFLRTAIHLWSRGCDTRQYYDLPFHLQDIFDPKQYGFNHTIFDYEKALGDEPNRMAKLPLTQVIKIPPPAEFAELCRLDNRGEK